MSAEKIGAMTQLVDITECCICLKTLTDPRMLPCIHTFCFQCIQDMVEKTGKINGDALPCPVCRKEFQIPNDGINVIQKNFFMTSLIEALNHSKIESLPCDLCKANTEVDAANLPEAAVRCFVCQNNLCECCLKLHQAFKSMNNHKIAKIGKNIQVEEVVMNLQTVNCDIHRGKVLDYYCTECKKVVCVSCFVESHRTHDCKDVNTVEEEFRQVIGRSSASISKLAEELLIKKTKLGTREDFLKKMNEREQEILQRSEELKEMIDSQTKSLLILLDEIKSRHLKELQTEEDEFDTRVTIVESFSKYCDELRSKGSASDVCRSKDDLLRRADELEESHETYIMRPLVSFDVNFHATDLDNMLTKTNGNIIGELKCTDLTGKKHGVEGDKDPNSCCEVEVAGERNWKQEDGERYTYWKAENGEKVWKEENGEEADEEEADDHANFVLFD